MNDMMGKMRGWLKPWMTGSSPLEIRRAILDDVEAREFRLQCVGKPAGAVGRIVVNDEDPPRGPLVREPPRPQRAERHDRRGRQEQVAGEEAGHPRRRNGSAVEGVEPAQLPLPPAPP